MSKNKLDTVCQKTNIKRRANFNFFKGFNEMKYNYIDHRDWLASFIKEIRNDKDGFYSAVNKVYNYEMNRNGSFDGSDFWSYDQNASDTISELGWRQVLFQPYVWGGYYEKIQEAMSLHQFDYTDKQIIEKAKTI